MKFLELLRLIVEDVTFFVDKEAPEVFYAKYVNHVDSVELSRIDSFAFRSYLAVKSTDVTDNEQVIEVERAIKHLQYELSAFKACEEITAFVRIAGDLGSFIEYDLQNANGESVLVTDEGWTIGEKESAFITTNNSLAQVTPKETTQSPLELLKPFINLTGDDLVMFVIWMIQAFSRGTHHAMLVWAEKGSGKTVLSKMLKAIVDPFRFAVSAIPDKKSDLIVLLYNTWLCCLDNVSDISDEYSDLLCGAISGTASPTRSLFTNLELSVAPLHSTILINGINVVPGKDDLAERMLVVTPKKLKAGIEQEKKLWASFSEQLPYILGSIFNTLSAAIVEYPNLKITWMPRMADSYVEMMAIAKALGINEDEFCKMYTENKKKLENLRSGSPVVSAIDEYMKNVKGRKVTKGSENMYNDIVSSYTGDKTQLPSASFSFTKKMDEEFNKILKAGYRVFVDDSSSHGSEVTILKKKK